MLSIIKSIVKKILRPFVRPFFSRIQLAVRKELEDTSPLSVSAKGRRNSIKLLRANEIAGVHYDTFSSYRHCYSGKKVVVLATGPTLNNYTPIEGAIHIGVNSAFESNVRLDYLVVSDFDVAYRNETFYKGIEMLDCKKFFAYWLLESHQHKTCSESFAIKVKADRFYADLNNTKYPVDIRYNALASHGSVIFHALQFAIFTNPSELYLVGCDVSGAGHFNGDTTTDHIIVENAQKYIKGYIKFKEFVSLHYPETKIISINPVGLKGIFNDIFTDND